MEIECLNLLSSTMSRELRRRFLRHEEYRDLVQINSKLYIVLSVLESILF